MLLEVVFLLSGKNKNDNGNESRKLCLVFVSCAQKSIGLKLRNLSDWNPESDRIETPKSLGLDFRRQKMRLPFCDGRRIVIQI